MWHRTRLLGAAGTGEASRGPETGTMRARSEITGLGAGRETQAKF